MARANRHFIPGQIWHLAHRCYKREFLLKFSKDRSLWMELWFEAKKRYRLSILTSSPIRLVVSADHGIGSMPSARQLNGKKAVITRSRSPRSDTD